MDTLRRELEELRGRVEEIAESVGRPRERAARTTGRDLVDELRSILPEEGTSAAMQIGLVLGNRNGYWNSVTTVGPIGPEGDVSEAARVFSALGNEMRLRLLQLLWEKERAAQELTEGTGLTQGAVYHHVRELSAFRWVESPRRNVYRITPSGRKALVCAREFSSFLGIVLEEPGPKEEPEEEAQPAEE